MNSAFVTCSSALRPFATPNAVSAATMDKTVHHQPPSQLALTTPANIPTIPAKKNLSGTWQILARLYAKTAAQLLNVMVRCHRRVHWLQLVGLRSQRWAGSCLWRGAGRGPWVLAAMLASTLRRLRMPGMMVLTSGLLRMKRNAIWDMELSAGTSGRSASAWATLFFRFSGTK